jgi:hypothetical protein
MAIHNVTQRTAGLALALSMMATAAVGQGTPPPKKSAPAKKTTAPAPAKLEIDPKAVEVLRAASDKLAGAKTLSFTAVELFEQLSRQGAPLAYTNKYEVTM